MRGQGALEFIGTYGWALLMVLVAMAALAYFGVLNPSSMLPKKFIFDNPGVYVEDFGASGVSYVGFILLNNYGKTISASTWNITVTGNGCPVTHPIGQYRMGQNGNYVYAPFPLTIGSWPAEEKLYFKICCLSEVGESCGNFKSGAQEKIVVNVNGTFTGSTYTFRNSASTTITIA
ncbi:MAG: hypothetical protein V1725_04815 [archaeon]